MSGVLPVFQDMNYLNYRLQVTLSDVLLISLSSKFLVHMVYNLHLNSEYFIIIV